MTIELQIAKWNTIKADENLAKALNKVNEVVKDSGITIAMEMSGIYYYMEHKEKSTKEVVKHVLAKNETLYQRDAYIEMMKIFTEFEYNYYKHL